MSTTGVNESIRQSPGDRDAAGNVHTEGFSDPSKKGGNERGQGNPNEKIRDDARQVRDRLNEGASSAARDVKARAASFADEQRQYGAERLEGVANVVDKAADDLERELPEAAGLVRGAARGLNDFSNNLRDRSTGELVNSVTNFARREPAAFFGTAVLAGFALSRFLKSTSDRPVDNYPSSGNASHRDRQDARGSHAQHDVSRADNRGSWPEMEEASVTPASRKDTSWDRPSDSPAPSEDANRTASVDAQDVSPTEPGMGYSKPNMTKN